MDCVCNSVVLLGGVRAGGGVLLGGVRTGGEVLVCGGVRDPTVVFARNGGGVLSPRGPILVTSFRRGGVFSTTGLGFLDSVVSVLDLASLELVCAREFSAVVVTMRTVPLGPRLGCASAKGYREFLG